MNRIPVRLGPLALLLAVVAICVTVLGLLTFTTARGDLAMAERHAASVQARYSLEAQGQAFLQGLEEDPAALAALERDGNGACWQTFQQEGASLRIGLQPQEDGFQVVSWQFSQDWEPQEELGGLWPGE